MGAAHPTRIFTRVAGHINFHHFIAMQDLHEFPLEVKEFEDRGRGYVATRAIHEGEVVLRCIPTVVIPSLSTCQQELICCGCFRNDLPLTRCTKCNAVSHCAPCKRGRNGTIHSDECDSLARLISGENPEASYGFRILLQAFDHQDSSGLESHKSGS